MLVAQGVAQIIAQLTFVPPLITRLGPLRSFRRSMLLLTALAGFPAISRAASSPPLMWMLLSIAVAFRAVVMSVAFTAVMIAINNSSRGRSLGLVNGLGQTAASFVRSVGPFLGGPLFSASLGFTALGSWRLHTVYFVAAAFAAAASFWAHWLPEWLDTTPSFDDVAEAHSKEAAARRHGAAREAPTEPKGAAAEAAAAAAP